MKLRALFLQSITLCNLFNNLKADDPIAAELTVEYTNLNLSSNLSQTMPKSQSKGSSRPLDNQPQPQAEEDQEATSSSSSKDRRFG